MSKKLFEDMTTSEAVHPSASSAEPYMRSKQDLKDLFENEASLPGLRKYPNGVVSVERPRRGHDY
jgi:hypothetical protein